MKKLIMILACVVSIIGAQAQTKIAEYENSRGDSYAVTLLLKKNKPYKVSIECDIKGKSKGEIWIKPNEVSKFRDALVSLKEKFEEWNNVAEQNNVSSASKDMPIKFPRVEFVWGHSTTFFSNGIFKPKWFIQDQVMFVWLYANVTASTNRYVDERFDFTFFDPQDAQNLIDAISQENVDAAINSVDNNDLFN